MQGIGYSFVTMIAALFLHVNMHAAEIRWHHNYEVAAQQALEEEKNIFVLITSETCRWCRKLEETTLEDDTIAARINAHYIAVTLTREKDSYPSYLHAKMVPMSFFLTPQGRVINSMPGYWNVEDYHSILDDVTYELNKQHRKQ